MSVVKTLNFSLKYSWGQAATPHNSDLSTFCHSPFSNCLVSAAVVGNVGNVSACTLALHLSLTASQKQRTLKRGGPGNKYPAAAAAAKSLQSCPTLCDPIHGSSPGSPVPGILQARTLEWVAISFSNAWKWKVKGKSLSRVRLLATPWTAANQASPSMGFSRQEYWSGLPFHSPGDLPDPGIKLACFCGSSYVLSGSVALECWLLTR